MASNVTARVHFEKTRQQQKVLINVSFSLRPADTIRRAFLVYADILKQIFVTEVKNGQSS